MTNTEHLISTADAAQVLGKSTRTIYRMVNAGTLTPAIIAPGGRVGSYLFDRADIDKLAERETA